MAVNSGQGRALLPASWAERPSAPSNQAASPVGRREVVRALKFAAAGSDPDVLEWAIDKASNAGVSSDVLHVAHKRKASLDAETSGARRQKRDLEVLGALRSALGSGSVDMLDQALEEAEQAGVGGEILQHAREERARLADDYRRQQAKSVSLSSIRAARQSMDVPGLMQAIQEAIQVNANPELIKRDALGVAKDGSDQRHAMATCILKFATESSYTDVLDLAMSWARSQSVDGDVVSKASLHKARLEEEASKQRAVAEAASALAVAWEQPEVSVLSRAIDRASAAGVNQEMLGLAYKRLRTLKRNARSAELQAAADAVRVEAVTVAASMVPAAEVAERREHCKEAGTALKSAMARGNAYQLMAAIQQAEQAGVSRETIAPARRKLARLEKGN